MSEDQPGGASALTDAQTAGKAFLPGVSLRVFLRGNQLPEGSSLFSVWVSIIPSTEGPSRTHGRRRSELALCSTGAMRFPGVVGSWASGLVPGHHGSPCSGLPLGLELHHQLSWVSSSQTADCRPPLGEPIPPRKSPSADLYVSYRLFLGRTLAHVTSCASSPWPPSLPDIHPHGTPTST